ncbi:hypothetical protein DFH08DRAFT_919019 [Mycena albidolilacea]|uniref:CxC1-like cysteine cluster associated with KDZ transposases domain-containing protein n=1 Tax=Mycena albidolilacea TaxID=1033008 RepID=A0AAD6YZL6_9AGAR|nr:hypothetical protein DFH08DRAFT_919019 [Mycena albidolilacea]
MVTRPEKDVEENLRSEPDLWEPDRTPPPSPSKHGRKRVAQWQRWQTEVIPNLIPHYIDVLYESKSLRDLEKLVPQSTACNCMGHTRKITIIRFSCIEDVTIKICVCTPAAVQLIHVGAFPCAPFLPSLAVDLRVLEFARNLFLQISPNHTAFSVTLECTLKTMGFQLDHQNSLRKRFASCLQWYSHMKNKTTARYQAIADTARPEPPVATSHLQREGTNTSNDGDAASPSTPPVTPQGIHVEREVPRKHHARHSSMTPTRARAGAEYLRSRCPLCFGNLEHDGSMLADVIVSLDACFTQKKNKSPTDPPRTHPKTHFIPDAHTARTEEYVEYVRAGDPRQKRKKPAIARATMVNNDDDDGYEHPELLLPRSPDFFEDTGLMSLLCRHDRVLWVVNMHSAGEKQFYVIALLETLFQHLQLNISVGFLYDVACTLERTCRKWGFLSRYMGRLDFAVSVFHAFGHEWACQLLYHPRKRSGFGLADGEGCERFWHSISHLISHLRISGYHNRLYTLDSQIDHADEVSLLRFGDWIKRRHLHTTRKLREAEKALEECKQSLEVLREQWLLQVQAQTKPLPPYVAKKNRGEQAVNAVIMLRAAIKTRRMRVSELRDIFLNAVQEDDPDAVMHQAAMGAAEEALSKAEKQLHERETALGIQEHQALRKLGKSTYIRLRMNSRALKRRLRDRLRARKFELDKVERSFRRLVNDQKLYAHTEAAKAPPHSMAPLPIPADHVWQLDLDDDIWQDVGLDDDEISAEPPLWLCDEKVRSGIRAMLELDRCKEENVRLKKERCAMQVWFAEEWQVVNLALEQAESAADKYQFKLLRDKLVRLCATWDRALPDLGVDIASLPPWGPEPEQLSQCAVDVHRPARGEDRHYGTADDASDEDDDGISEGEGEEDFELLAALEMADIYREGVNEFC